MPFVRHPGVILRDDFMSPLRMNVSELADLAGVSQQRLYELLAGKRGVSVDTALRFGRVFRMKPKHWLAMQAAWDLNQAEEPVDARGADLREFVTGPRGVQRLPASKPCDPVDTSFPPDMADAVRRAAEILRPFKAAS